METESNYHSTMPVKTYTVDQCSAVETVKHELRRTRLDRIVKREASPLGEAYKLESENAHVVREENCGRCPAIRYFEHG